MLTTEHTINTNINKKYIHLKIDILSKDTRFNSKVKLKNINSYLSSGTRKNVSLAFIYTNSAGIVSRLTFYMHENKYRIS